MSSMQSQLLALARSHKLLGHVVKWYYDTASGNITQGFIRGVILYFIPVTLLRRKLKLETLQRAIAVGLFTGSFRAIHQYLSTGSRKEKLDQLAISYGKSPEFAQNLKKAIAGGLGAIVLVMVDKSLINSIFVLWCLCRAIPFLLPSVPYGPMIVMCLAAAQIGVTWVKRPLLMDQTYRKFLISQGGKSAQTLDFFATDFPAGKLCEYSHPGQTCTQHGVHYVATGFYRAVKLYLPLYLVFFAISKKRSLKNLFTGLFRSSLFLCLYCSAAWVMLCMLYSKHLVRPNHKVNSLSLYLRLWLSGVPVLLERKSRQVELAQYCATYAVDTIYRYLEFKKIVAPSYTIGVLLTSFAWSILLWNSDSQPTILSRWLFGIGANKKDQRPQLEEPEQLVRV